MTEENQKLMEEIFEVLSKHFGAKYTLWYYQDKRKQSKKIVVEYVGKN